MTQMGEVVKSLAEKKAGSGGRVLDMRHRQLPQFAGGTGGQYDDWAFAFKRVVRTMDPVAYDMLVKTEGGGTA